MKTVTIKFSSFGNNLGTRVSGAKVRTRIIEELKTNQKIIFDFSNVMVVSNSFADECFAKLLLEMDFESLKKKTNFINVSPFVGSVISTSINERYRQAVVH